MHYFPGVVFAALVVAGCSSVPTHHPQFGKSCASLTAEELLYPVRNFSPSYPKSAAAEGVQGSVRLSFRMNEFGRPIDIAVTNSSPPGVFDQAAIEAFEKWQYCPPVEALAETESIQLDFALGR